MLRYSFARIVGVVVAVFTLVPLVIQAGDRRWIAVGVLLLVLAGGLWLAFWGDHRLRAAQVQRALQIQQEGEAFQGFELNLSLRWFKWGLLTTLLAAGVLLVWRWMLPDLWASGLQAKAVVAGVISAPFALLVPGLLATGLRALTGQPLLHIGPLGLQIHAWPVLPWMHLYGVDLREIEIKGQKQWSLVLATDDAYRRSLPSRWSALFWQWPIARLQRKQGLIEVALGFLDQNPHTVAHAIRKIGARHGAPLVEGWHHSQPIAEARDVQRARRDADEAARALDLSLQELRRLSTQSTADPVRVAALNQRISGELERMNATSEAQLVHMKKEGERLQRHARTALRGLWIVFGLVMTWVAVRIALALAR